MLPLHPALLSQPDYLFSQIAAAAEEERKRHPHRRVISLGIGDVTQPIAPVAAAALRTAAAELATQKGQKGYGPAAGYPFLREAIAQFDYQKRGVDIQPQEIFISDGSYRYRGQQGSPGGALFPVGALRAGLGLRSGLPRLPGPGRSRRAPGFFAALPGGK